MSYKRFSVIWVVVTLMVSIGSSGASAAVCKPSVAAKGAWTNYLAAKSSARVHWRRAARKLYGRKYGSWVWSKNKAYKCTKKGYLRRCYARARPCR